MSSQGESRGVTLDSLGAVVNAVEGDSGRPPNGEIRGLGIGPEVAQTQGDELPDIL